MKPKFKKSAAAVAAVVAVAAVAAVALLATAAAAPPRPAAVRWWFERRPPQPAMAGRPRPSVAAVDEDVASSCPAVPPTRAATSSTNDEEDPSWWQTEATILRYLDEEGKSVNRENFHIQGWRWHTMALVREATRLHRWSERKLAQHAAGNDGDGDAVVAPADVEAGDSLKRAADYVVGFNMKGLHAIERDVFFPWVRSKVGSIQNLPRDVSSAFRTVLDRLDREQQTIEALGRSLQTAAVSDPASGSSSSGQLASREVLAGVSSTAAAIADRAKSMLDFGDRLLVPTVAAIVPASEQKALNDKVIRKLGILDSRLHLVGMHEAVWEHDNDEERRLFESSIPSIPRRMIPRWRRLLYQPRVGAVLLEDDDNQEV